MSSFPDKAGVLVVGGGVAGVIAAVAAARSGADTVLVEAHSYPGGMANQALVQPYQTFHSERGQVIRGLAQEYVDRMFEHGGSPGHKLDPLGFAATVTPMDDRISRHVMLEWLAEECVEILLATAGIEVRCEGGGIKALKLATLNQAAFPEGVPFGHWEREDIPAVQEWWIEPRAVVDATGCAKVAKLAGVPADLSDTRQPMSWLFALGGVDEEELRNHIAGNRSDFVLNPDPRALEDGYIGVAGFFSLVREAKERGEWTLPRDRLLFFGTPVPGEVMVNTTRIPHGFGTDEEITAEGLRQISFLIDFFRARVPGFGECFISRRAERLGVRESYRIEGEYRLTREDVLFCRKFDDVVALGAFPIDIHSSTDEELHAEKIGERGHYDIPFRCLVSNRVKNLVMAGRHVSVTHEAFASTRVMPTSMALGQAAGVVAALIADKGDAPYQSVRDALLGGGAVLDDSQVSWGN